MKSFLLTFFCFVIIASAQTDSAFIEKGRKFLYDNETRHRPFYLDTIRHEVREMPYERAAERYIFLGEIKTPLTKTKFLHYFITTSTPSPGYIIVSYKGTLRLLIEWACSKGYACKYLINFLNERLLDEGELDEQQLTELAYALLKISSPAWYFDKILKSYDDVSWVGDNNSIMHLPWRFKRMIKPITTKTEDDSIVLEYFLWNEVTLKKIILGYRNHKIDVKTQQLWDSGRRISVM